MSALVPFDDWFNARMKKPDGELYGKRAKQVIIKKFRLPVILVGWSRLIDPEAGDACLSQYAQYTTTPAKRGRPRMVIK